MAYKLEVDGMTEITRQLEAMADRAEAIASKALYDGAGLMAEEVNKGAGQIKTAPFKYAGSGQTRLPSPEEKEIVEKAAAGIAKFDKEGGSVDTSVGFRNAGYADLNGKTVPIPKIVNAINSGTSFMNKQPFVRKAAKAATPKVLAAMQERIDAEIDAIGKEVK